MKPYFQDNLTTLYHGDCLDVLPRIAGVTAVLTDPPYGLDFMGKNWDYGIPGQHFWEIAIEACIPGAPLLAFGGTRTHHHLWCAIENAGWEIRDTLMWLYGSGFPKSLDISKAIDRANGVKGEVIGLGRGRTGPAAQPNGGSLHSDDNYQWPGVFDITAPATPAAKEWQGYGTALKPAWEPICLAMKPLDSTFACNALTHGVAGLNIDECRIGTTKDVPASPSRTAGNSLSGSLDGSLRHETGHENGHNPNIGRWPANLLLDEEATAILDEQSGKLKSGGYPPAGRQRSRVATYGNPNTRGEQQFGSSEGGASRFFYCAKASRMERGNGNNHPTVKPKALLRYLLTLVKMPDDNLILDQFAGSGSTLLAARELGIRNIGIEKDEDSCAITVNRIMQAAGKRLAHA